MTDIAEGEGGAGRAWTKGAVAQKGHARHAEPRRKFSILNYRFTPCHREGSSLLSSRGLKARGDPL